MISTFDRTVRVLISSGDLPTKPTRLYRYVLMVCIIGTTIVPMIDTVPDFWGANQSLVDGLEWLGLIIMTLDYLLRLREAWLDAGQDDTLLKHWQALATYAFNPYGIFDFIAILPLCLTLVGWPLSEDQHTILGVMRFLKLARYSPAIETLAAAIISELKPLSSALFIVALLAIASATVLYFVERQVNSSFATLPNALWWAIVTLTTVGYGDVIPMTVVGKLLNSVVAVLGLCMFAMPASILATGFSEEMKRRSFMSTWSLVAKVPLFANMHAGQIADIAALLRPQRLIKGEAVIEEGEVGNSMYFVVAGSLEARAKGSDKVYRLHAGDFFGEIALIERKPRNATVTTTTSCQLLSLDVLDFQNFINSHPDLLEVFRQAAKARMEKN